MYNCYIMTIQEWQGIISLIIGIAAVAGIVFTILRFYIKAFAKQELEDIRHELKPNSGSSMKDQITRLESSHERMEKENDAMNKKLDKMEEKVDKIFDIILKHFGSH